MKILAVLIFSLLTFKAGFSQDYRYSAGNPTFAVNIPVDNGFINISNGNLHLEFPLATHKQRGALALNERLVYDSKFWMIGHYSNYYWWPDNVPRTTDLAAGWRFVNGNEAGSVGSYFFSGNSNYCSNGGSESFNDNYELDYFTWKDPQGTNHTFNALYGFHYVPQECGQPDETPETVEGYATDGSGYKMVINGTASAVLDIHVIDNQGTQVFPQSIDRYGNYWGKDVSGNLIDDLGRTPVVKTSSGNSIYLDVLTSSGNTARYTITTTPLSIHTNFQQTGTAEWVGSLNAIQSIALPDGSTYEFGYEPQFGVLTDMKLPSGGHVYFGYDTYYDSYRNKNRWLTSVTKDGSLTRIFPQVVNYCAANETGCQETVTVTRAPRLKPDGTTASTGDATVYTLNVNNGLWNTNVVTYDGLASSGQVLGSQTNTYDFTHPCPGICLGAMYITRSSQIETLPGGAQTKVETVYDSPEFGKPSKIKKWNLYTGTAPASPDLLTEYSYSGFDLSSEVLKDNSGNRIAETDYDYGTSAEATSNITGHGTQNAGGPYLNAVRVWDDRTNTFAKTFYTYYDTGAVKTVVDPIGNTGTQASHTTTFGYDATQTFITSTNRPQTNGISHETSSGYDFSSGQIGSTNDENSVAHGSTHATTYEYYISGNDIGRLHYVYYPDGGQVTYSYSLSPTTATVETKIDAGQTTTTKTIMDSFGRPYRQAVQDGTQWILTDTCYDNRGLVLAVSKPYQSASLTGGAVCDAGNAVRTYYDAIGRTVDQLQLDGTTHLKWSYTDNSVEFSDGSSTPRKWTRTFDAFGHLTQVTEPGNIVTQYTYAPIGTLRTVVQNSGGTNPVSRSFTYDSMSRIVCAANPEGFPKNFSGAIACPATASGTMPSAATRYEYDANGNLALKTDPRGVKTHYGYDALNRMTSKTYEDNQNTLSTCLQYDQSDFTSNTNLRGHLANVWTQSGTCPVSPNIAGTGVQVRKSVLAYDVMGRIKSARTCILGNCPDSFHYNYDLAGNITYYDGGPAGLAFTQEFDSLGRLTKVTEAHDNTHPLFSPPASGAQYGPAGLLGFDFGNVLTMGRTYDGQQRVSGEVTKTK